MDGPPVCYDTPVGSDPAFMIVQPYMMTNPTPEQLEQMRLAAFEDICMRHELSDLFASKLRGLEGFKIHIICDDSGSMTAIANSSDAPERAHGNPYGPKATRWDELRTAVKMIVDIAGVLGQDGVDIHFLNRDGLSNVTNWAQIEPYFVAKPSGRTPIVPVLQSIYAHQTDNKRLVILLTDGEPTDPIGNVDVNTFKKVLMGRARTDYVNIIACTDDDATIAYLNNWDVEIPRLDVTDDYGNEKESILQMQGKDFHFSKGDYIVKCMLGSVDDWFDTLDEKPINGPVKYAAHHHYHASSSSGHKHKPACKCTLF